MDDSDIRAVVFDLDGTLYSTPRYLKARITARLWRDLPMLRHVTHSRDRLRDREFEDGEALRAAFFTELAAASGRSPAACRDFYLQRFLSAFVDVLAARARARTGMVEVLARLRSAGIKLAVVSDYAAIEARLAAIGVASTSFDLLLAAEDSGALKPSPRAFRLASSSLGTPAERVLIVGDRHDMDEDAAIAAGMHFMGVADPASGDGYPAWEDGAARLVALALGVARR